MADSDEQKLQAELKAAALRKTQKLQKDSLAKIRKKIKKKKGK